MMQDSVLGKVEYSNAAEAPMSPLASATKRVNNAVTHVRELSAQLEHHADRLYGSTSDGTAKSGAVPAPPEAALYALDYSLDELQSALVRLDEQVSRNTSIA